MTAEVFDVITETFVTVADKCAEVGALGHDSKGHDLSTEQWLGTLPEDAATCEALNDIGWKVLGSADCWTDDQFAERMAFNVQLLRLRDIGVAFERGDFRE